MSTVIAFSAVDMSALNLVNIVNGQAQLASSTQYNISYGSLLNQDQFSGTGFNYNSSGIPTSGTITSWQGTVGGVKYGSITGLSVPVGQFVEYVFANNNAAAKQLFLSGDDNIQGSSGSDTLQGYDGNDIISGGGGNDIIDGGSGIDTLYLSGLYTDYSINFTSSGFYTVKDYRAGSPDGTDVVTNFEIINCNGALYYFSSSIASWVRFGFDFALRQDPYANSSSSNPFPSGSAAVAFNALVKTAEVSGFSVQQAQAKVIELARQTTSVATIAYEFFTHSTPSSAGLDYLVSPTGVNANNLNSAYYQNFGLENRYINFAVNLGKNGEGKAAFAAGYSSLSLFDATRKAYTTLFGSTPSDTKLHALLDPTFAVNGTTMTRSDYFAYYGGDGPNGIGTKAAMVGWLMSEAVKADVGVYATANDLYLTDLANGKSVYAVDLVGVYHGTPFIST